ncbi:MAG: transglycosylase SLT domain-containing protein [Candidatus Rokubacteria bacterium]|nr:transglycosylase SLT domain-containing protein [Candidatus Rokubacteria bacterium]
MRRGGAVLVLLLGGWLGAAGAGSPALTPEERARFSTTVEALRTGDWPTAVAGFRMVSERASVLTDYARFFLAESLSRVGDLAGARKAVESLAVEESDSRLVPDALFRAAHLASQEGDEAGAERFLRRLLSWFPATPEGPLARYLLGLTLEAQGRGLEAAQSFRELWLLAPWTPYGEAAGDRLAALAQAGVVLPAPTQEERLERAERLLAGGASAPAREEAEALLAERPGAELALRALGVLAESLRRSGRYRQAAAAVDRSLALAPAPRRPLLLLELGRLQYRAGAYEAALGSLGRLIQQFPKEREVARALVLKGRVLEDAGRVNEAVGAYRRATGEFPDHEAAALAFWRLGWIAYLRGDLAGAAREFGEVAELPAGRAYRRQSAYWAGRCREALGEPDAAQRFFRRLLAEAPRSYYGILASRRVRGAGEAPGGSLPLRLPSDPLAPLAAELRFAKVEALRAVGLVHHASAELEEISASAGSDPLKLYGLSALWARAEEHHLALRILRRYFVDVAWSGHPGLPRRFWELFYPMSWTREVRQAAERVGLDVYLVAAVVREESSFFPQARSRAGARGLMQLMPHTARPLALRRGLAFGNGDLLDDPRLNLELGAEVLAGLLKEFGDPRLALAAYNAGPLRAREWWRARRSDDLEAFVEQIPFEETRAFVKRVLVSWEEYRRIYGGS